jgi:hypothetical protein
MNLIDIKLFQFTIWDSLAGNLLKSIKILEFVLKIEHSI